MDRTSSSRALGTMQSKSRIGVRTVLLRICYCQSLFKNLIPDSSTSNHYIECFRDCEDAYLQGVTTSGIYKIQPDDTGPPFNVYCDMDTDEGGWTVFQRRKDGSVDFYLNWIDYVRGFGDLNGEFWLGLRNIHRLTASASHSQLRVDMEDFDSNVAYAKYDSFNVGDAASRYTLGVAGYSGTAGDSLVYHNGMTFSTKDEDNDAWGDNCAVTYKGAWWYNSCHLSNLNGLYLSGPVTSYADSVNWNTWKGYYYSLKFTEMKTRPN